MKANEGIACNGMQQAYAVIFGLLTSQGGMIGTEELNDPGIKLLADTYRIRLLGIPMDGEGMRTDALEQICRREKVAFVLCSPTAHNPTTITLSVERRQR